MSESKTEKPTLKKQREARSRGHVAYSSDASSAVVICVVFIILIWISGSFVSKWQQMASSVWTDKMFSGQDLWNELLSMCFSFFKQAFITVILPAFFGGLLAGYLQVGPLFRSVKMDPNRVNPVHGVKQIITKKRFIELLKTVLKFAIFVSISGYLIWNRLVPLTAIPVFQMENLIVYYGDYCKLFLTYTMLITAMFGMVDYYVQKRNWLNDLKMTRNEVQREHKDSEGDPLLRGIRKQFYSELVQDGLVNRVSRSKLVVVNPTHYAVAIEYNENWGGAPRVSAKGYRNSAAKIRSMAAEHNVPVLRHPPLARKLYILTLDQEIPEELFRAVAELLVYVSQLTESDRLKCR